MAWAVAKLRAWLSNRSELKITCLITFESFQGDFGITRPNKLRESLIETFHRRLQVGGFRRSSLDRYRWLLTASRTIPTNLKVTAPSCAFVFA
jgi:hypothetical protein